MATHRSGRDQDWTDQEAEGQPALDTQPPGIDSETASEGHYPPRDHPVAAEEVGVTAREEAVPETLEERVRRERPDEPQRPPEDPAGRLVDTDVGEGRDDPAAVGEWDADDGGLSAEEEAVHVRRE